ncbi:MAG: hypothetical protein ACP5N9_02410 [Candidatus Bilamarchaeum sp.]|jgi:hypothetical protein
MSDFFILEPCTSANGLEIKFKEKSIDLEKTEHLVERKGGTVAATTKVVLIGKLDGFDLTVYASGRIMVKSDKKNKEQTTKFCNLLVEQMSSFNCICSVKGF